MRHLKHTFISVLLLLLSFSLFISCKNDSKTFFEISLISVDGEEVDMLDDPSVDIEGKVGNPINGTVIVLQANRARFSEYKKGTNVSSWFKNTVEGLKYELQSDIVPPYDKAEVRIYGTPLETRNDTSYALSINFSTFIAGTIRREAVIENFGKYKIGEPDAVILEVLYPQEVLGVINKALPRTYDIVLHMRKDGSRENLRLTEKNNVVLGTSDEEMNFINRIDGLNYTLNTSKSEGVDYYDTLTVTISGSPNDSKVHTEDIQFKVPLKDTYIGNLGQYADLKGVNVIQNKKINYNIGESLPEIEPEFEEGEYIVNAVRNRKMAEHTFEIKLKEGSGTFYPKKRETFDPYYTYSYGYNNYRYVEGKVISGLKWEWEVKDDDLSTLYVYISGTPSEASLADFTFNVSPYFIKMNSGTFSKPKFPVTMKYHILHPVPKLKFENAEILIGDRDGNGIYQTVQNHNMYDEFSYSIDNPNFVDNLYSNKTSLIISVAIDDTDKDGFSFIVSDKTPIPDNVFLSDTIVYKGETIPNPLKGKNISITCGSIVLDGYESGIPKYYVRSDWGMGGTVNERFAIIIEIPSDERQGDTPVLPTDDLYPLCLKIGSRVFEQNNSGGTYAEDLSLAFTDENGVQVKEGEQAFYEVSAGENDENRSYVGVFDRKYTPYIADGAAVTYYEDYYTEPPFGDENKFLIIRPRLSDNASMTKNGGVPITYVTDPKRPDCVGALVLEPAMDPNYPTHILPSSFPDVSAYTRRGFKKVGWSTVMGSGLVDYSTPLNGDNGGQPYKNTIENVAKWGLWLPRSAGYVWPTPIDYPVSLAWYFDLDHYWTKNDISDGGTTFVSTFKFMPKSDTTNTDVTVKSDEKYKVFDKDGNEVPNKETYPDSDESRSDKNTTDDTALGQVYTEDRYYHNKSSYNEVSIPAKGYALPDSYWPGTGKTVPHKMVFDHDFAIGEYFVTGYMHDVLYKWNIGSGTEENPEHGYIIPPLSQATIDDTADHTVVGYVDPSKLISYEREDALSYSSIPSGEYANTFYKGGALQSNANNVLYGGFSKSFWGSDNRAIRTRSYPLTWVSFTQAMVICNAFTEYYNEKSGDSLTPAYTTDHSLNWATAVKRVEDAINMIGDANKDQIPVGSFAWNYETFANLEATGFRLPTYDEWEFATKIFVDRVEIANEDSEMNKTGRENGHWGVMASDPKNYERIIADITHAGERWNQHPKAKGYKANVHANRTLGPNPQSVTYAVANGSSYPMFLTDKYTPLYYGPYRLENIPEFIKLNNTSYSPDAIEDKARIARNNLVLHYTYSTLWYGSSNVSNFYNKYGVKILPTMHINVGPFPLEADTTTTNVMKPSPIGLYGIGGYVSELTDRFAGTDPSDKKALYTTNGTAFMDDPNTISYQQGSSYGASSAFDNYAYNGAKTFKVHPNVHYPNQGMRMCRTINIAD